MVLTGRTSILLFLTLTVCGPSTVYGSIEDGGDLLDDYTIRQYESGLLIRNTLKVTVGVTLTIEPGVEVRFGPGVMLAINGTLIAQGTEQQRIRMTKDPDEGPSGVPQWPANIRLVDEPTVTKGRLQILYGENWRGVCANFQNWTDVDTNVTCRQLGFRGGKFSFVSYTRNDSLYMLYHRPQCTGEEREILDCPGSRNIFIGSKQCENQQTIHLECEGLAEWSSRGYWWGLEFYNATKKSVSHGGALIEESTSKLEYVDIEYAGVDNLGQPAPAIRASPIAPKLINTHIKYSALDATNFTEIKSSMVVRYSELSDNRGNGLIIESHYGRIDIRDSNIHHNMGNGVKLKLLDGKYPIFDVRDTFCKAPEQSTETYPKLMSGIPLTWLQECKRTFSAISSEVLTLVVVEMDIEPQAHGSLTFYDGNSQLSPVITEVPIINGTMPQGITSTQNHLTVVFSYQLPQDCPTLHDCIKFTIMVDSGEETVPEFFMNNTAVNNNTQHGIFLENPRNYAFVNHSTITHNGYGAGFRVYGGASDVIINASTVDYNQDNGVNITYDGGYRIFNLSSFSHNYGNGVNVTFNETSVDNKTRLAKHQRTEVSRSVFEYNEGLGLRVGNYCRHGSAIVNDSRFIANGGDGVEFESCYNIIPDANVTNFTIGYNLFESNYGHAIKIAPLLNAVGRIGNNTFKFHKRHVLLLDNTDDFLLNRFYSQLKVDYEVSNNMFEFNEGFYVANLRLSQGSLRQSLIFRYNELENNLIEGAFPSLNERARAYAVVILSSSNIDMSRNALLNPESRYELATHLLDRSVELQATLCYWGTDPQRPNYEYIIARYFDQFSRYNLAEIMYHPVLKYNDLYGPWTTDDMRPLEVEFSRGNRLGGRLAEHFISEPGIKHYIVDRDLTILPLGTMEIRSGTTLEFENGLGVLVHGEMKVLGEETAPIKFTLKNESTITNHSLVRLADGATEYEGRLEVRPSEDDEWGTVCKLGWNLIDASVVCQMMGLVVHPADWNPFTEVAGQPYQPVWHSQVECTELDMDVTKCKADQRNEHSCDHTMDVSVRCKPPTWAGMRFLASARPSILKHVTVEKAGLMDPTAIVYAPAITIDYNQHTVEHINITNCMSSGISIMHNDVYANAKVAYATISYNLGNAISTRGPFFEVQFSHLHHNFWNGFDYNPHLTAFEAHQLLVGIESPEIINDALIQNGIDLADQGYKFIITPQNTDVERKVYRIEVRVNRNHRVVVDVIDYNPDTTEEKVIVYDGARASIQSGTERWEIEEDLVDFPVVSMGTVVTIHWEVLSTSSGRLALAVKSKPTFWEWPFPDLVVRNTTTEFNTKGIVTRHYNQPSNEYLDLFYRYRWQHITLYGVTFRGNREHALHVPSITKYHELYMPTFEELQNPHRVGEITYEVDSCYFTENGGGVLAEHNHIEFSNNVWIWGITANTFERNFNGGFDIELPKVNLMNQEIFNHSIDVNDTMFENNENFEMRIDGFYCNSSISRNRFQGNLCKLGCVSITGTEKDIEMSDNQFYENTGKYILEFDMDSHTPYTRWVYAQVSYNEFKRNKRIGSGQSHPSSSPTSYTVGIKGVQNITFTRNLLKNDGIDYELVAAQKSASLENYLDVTQNYWGIAGLQEGEYQTFIRQRIFDFDDWNNFAIAEYYPYLLYDDFASQESLEGKYNPVWDSTAPIGGRIEGHVRLNRDHSPYIVHSDLTVMSTASLYIEAGVELQFYPNVGILVLGSLNALGTEDNRIKLKPYELSQMTRWKRETRVKRDPGPTHGMARLVGGENDNEGFVEFYNATERRWTIICDSNFNEKTAEVTCRSMGRESSNVIILTDTLYDHWVLGYPKMHEQVIEWFWRETFICDGSEANLDQCRYRINYNLYHCMEYRQYVFMRCGPKNLAPEFDYWGNIRFSTPEYEHGNIGPGFSTADYVDIYGAGILHGEKAAAIQAVYRTPYTDNVRITNCASHGYDFIAPKDEFVVQNNEILNNNGYGVGGLVLNGESRDELRSSFKPLVDSLLPYNVYGLVEMCTSEKLIYVQERVLVYFKYNFETVDCIKVLRSKEPRKQVALRFLQLNLFNDTFYKNAVEMYNGEFFMSELFIGEVTPNSTDYNREIQYATNEFFDTMGIRITASPAHGVYGFIAEVVTLPLSPGWRPDLGPGVRQQIFNTAMMGNQGGGFHFMNAGELNPTVIIERCRIENGGYRILNFTSPSVMYLNIQNSRLLTISNNFISGNGGGIHILTDTNSLSTALYANITNNVIVDNTHGEALHVEGHHYQGFDIRRNYISRNVADYRNTISMFGIYLNFTSNVVYKNEAQTIINITVPEKVAINQNYLSNAIHDNFAMGSNKSTIFAGSAKHNFQYNFLFNWRNRYEMVTYNRTKYPELEERYPELMAQYNWWGSPNEFFISGRIWDRRDDDNLIKVNFDHFYTSNTSIPGVVQGKCRPGWRRNDRTNKCYLYMGGAVPFSEAKEHCLRENSVLAKARDRQTEVWIGELLLQQQENFDQEWRTWVYKDYRYTGKCTALINYQVVVVDDCEQLLPVVCEIDPYAIPLTNWRPIYITLGVLAGVLFIICLLCGCAYLKARQRTEKRLHRRNSLRASMRSSRNTLGTYSNKALIPDSSASAAPTGSAPGTMSSVHKRRRPQMTGRMDNSGVLDISGITVGETSTDSIEKYKLNSHRPGTPASTLDYDSSKLDASSYYDSDLPERYPHRMENEIPNIAARPMYDNMLRRPSPYDEQSLDRSGYAPPSHYSASSYAPSQYAPSQYEASTYAPSQYAPSQYAPSQYAPSQPRSTTPRRPDLQARNQSVSSDLSFASDANEGRRQRPPRPKPKETAM